MRNALTALAETVTDEKQKNVSDPQFCLHQDVR